MSMFSSKTGTTESSAKDLDRVRLAKQKKPKKTKEKAVRKVARTVQDTIPYEHVHGKYNFEVEKNRYSVTYSFSDVTYDAADAAEQERIFLAYGDLLNSFDTSDDIQITLHNNVINQKEFSSQILLKHAGDGFDEYRDEYNEMLLDKMQQGQNGITTKKYFTVTVTAATLELAQQKLAAKELYMRSCFQKIGSNIEKLKANERIRIIADIFRGVNQEIRPISSSEFLRGAEKSLCCPDYFEFKKDYFMYNDKFARMVYLKHLPSSLVDDMLKDLCETSLPIVVTVNIAPVEPSEAIKVVKRQLTAMRSNKMQKEKKASQHGVYSDVISDDLKQSLAEAEELSAAGKLPLKGAPHSHNGERLRIHAVQFKRAVAERRRLLRIESDHQQSDHLQPCKPYKRQWIYSRLPRIRQVVQRKAGNGECVPCDRR